MSSLEYKFLRILIRLQSLHTSNTKHNTELDIKDIFNIDCKHSNQLKINLNKNDTTTLIIIPNTIYSKSTSR